MIHQDVSIRAARRADLPAIARLFEDDELGAGRAGESTALSLDEALDDIQAEANNQVYIAELDGQVVGTFQLTFIRQLSYGGCRIAQLESVHVHSSSRSRGVGRAMLTWAIDEARRRNCLRIQLTTNVKRDRAHRFYERLGFTASHKGMKLYLEAR